jgi:hypothetical protein
MARKTALRRLSKILPMQIEMAEAVVIDEKAETGQAQGMERVLEGDFAVVDNDEAPGAETETEAPDVDDPTVDVHGEAFDPALHVASEVDGMPVKNKDGSFRKRRGAASAPEQTTQPEPPPVEDGDWPEMD